MGDRYRRDYSDTDSDDEPLYVKRDPRHDKHFDRKQELLWNCKGRATKTAQNKEPLIIAVIGPPGCGKSSFLNTVFAAFSNDHWAEHARYGHFCEKGKQITRKLKSFKKKDYYKDKDEYLMPTFLDMMGFEDDDSSLTKEILNIVFCGKLRDHETLSDVVDYGQKYGLRSLRNKYFGQKYFGIMSEFRVHNVVTELMDLFAIPNRKTLHRVNRIIVVCSANPDSELPEQLFEAITDVTSRERDITLYGVMTQGDKYKSRNQNVLEKERSFMQALGIPQERFARIRNYCPDVDPSMSYQDNIIPTLDVPVLRLMRQVLTQDRDDSEEDKSLKDRIKPMIIRFVPNLSNMFVLGLFIIFCILVLTILVSTAGSGSRHSYHGHHKH